MVFIFLIASMAIFAAGVLIWYGAADWRRERQRHKHSRERRRRRRENRQL